MDPLIILLLSAGLGAAPATANGPTLSEQVAKPNACVYPSGGFEPISVTFKKRADLSQNAALPNLDKLAASLRGSTCRIRIDGYSDQNGGTAEKQRISEERALAVRDYLTRHEVPADRIETAGHGELREAGLSAERKRVARISALP
jgi:outer membrane protein OmpA-like peptidoglycan-associated protein